MDWHAHLSRLSAAVRDHFGEAAVYRPLAGGEYFVTGVFDEAYRSTELDPDGAPVETTQPALTVRLADLAAVGVTPRTRDRLTVSERTWEVVGGTRSDGSGMATLLLVEV